MNFMNDLQQYINNFNRDGYVKICNAVDSTLIDDALEAYSKWKNKNMQAIIHNMQEGGFFRRLNNFHIDSSWKSLYENYLAF